MRNAKKRSLVFILLRLVVLSYAGLVLLMAGCQRNFIYYPARAEEAELLRQAAGLGLEVWPDEAGRPIGWKAPAESADGETRRVVVFHGNAGMALWRNFYVDGFRFTTGGDRWEIYLFEYPGYGSREGKPREKRFYVAAREAMDGLFAEKDEPIFLVGESLGSGVASRMAAEYPDRVGGVLLVTPFTNLADVGARHFGWLPVRLLLRDRFDNVEALADYRGPVAILLAEDDEVVPAEIGQELFDLYSGPKRLWIQEDRNHNTLDLSQDHPWWDELTCFLLDGER